MPGQIVAYVRVSSTDQNPARQLDAVAQFQPERIFQDASSGGNADRPALQDLLRYVREGDTIIVLSLDRLARNLIDLRHLVAELTGRGITVKFIKEGLEFSSVANNPMSTLLLSMLGAAAEFERSLIHERQAEGIRLAKKRGVYKGRARTLNAEQVNDIRQRLSLGVAKARIAREYGISRETLYRYLNEVAVAA
jgi:DNA invertase Pin-like site-specific DNA recombinase